MEIANVGDPRLVAEQLTARHQLVLSCPIDTACHCFISSLVCLLLAMEDVAVNRLATSILN